VSTTDLEQVLSNWINQAISPSGRLAEGQDPAKWVARQFLEWWQSNEVERPLNDAVLAMNGVHSELERLGGWNKTELGEAMHELIHLKDALDELRAALGLNGDR
jgi:hypothetical protein